MLKFENKSLGVKTWHEEVDIMAINTKYSARLLIEELITGCGIMQIKGLIELNKFSKKEICEILDYIKTFYNSRSSSRNCHYFIATLGSTFYDANEYYKDLEKKLLESGFTILDEYYNMAHNPSNHWQKLYSINFSKDRKK